MVLLPIDAVIPELKAKLEQERNVILTADPGAGKTTRVPLALLEETWLSHKRIVMLEPRRLAARAAAGFMSSARGEKLGATVGYRMRGDTRVSASTRIEVITEGVLTRMLQHDPSLEGVGLVIFDEFHERSLQADFGLALCLQAQALFREDLRLLIMSATLDAEPVSDLLGGASVVSSVGRSYPVETLYRPMRMRGGTSSWEAGVAVVIQEALHQQPEGDVLAFLPGAGEIRRTEAILRQELRGRNVIIAPLYGTLPQEAQDRALQPSKNGSRKVVLATSIAETSLTVEGVRIVVDGGLMRISRFSPRTGMTRLETISVSIASADQRRGRAGRLGPGVCYRLWSEAEELTLAPYNKPEILEADLTPLALELAVWGASDPAELLWLTPPPAAAYAQARELLAELGGLDAAGVVTTHGRRMAELGAEPRLAHMLLRAVPLGLGATACALAALLGERDLLRGAPGSADADVRLRLEALQAYTIGSADAGTDYAATKRAAAAEAAWRRALGVPEAEQCDLSACGMLLALAYPDRVGQSRGGGKYTLSGGRGAVLPMNQQLARAAYLVAVELDDQGADSRIWQAAPIELSQLQDIMADSIETISIVVWDRDTQSVQARTRIRFGALTLKESPLANPPAELVKSALLEGIRVEGLSILPWTKASTQMRERIDFLHRSNPAWPDVADEALLAELEEWLDHHVDGMRSRSDLQKLSMTSVLESQLSWEERGRLDREAPTHLTVPSGSRISIDYSDPEQPSLAVRLQEVFGWMETPRIGGGRVPITMQLLSPAQRPVQVTRDLSSFWRTTYFDVKKDLKGRYPKHYWPDDPLQATPTSRTKPRI